MDSYKVDQEGTVAAAKGISQLLFQLPNCHMEEIVLPSVPVNGHSMGQYLNVQDLVKIELLRYAVRSTQ